MKIQSAVLTNGSGSIGGMTAAKNRGGLYLRARAAVSNPQTAGQTLIRTALGSMSTLWRTLTEEQRQGWYDWAAVNPITNIFGDPILMTGHQAFVALNTPRVQAGLDEVQDAPAEFGALVTPVLHGAAPGIVIDDPSVDLTIPSRFKNEVDTNVLLYVSKPQSPTTRYFKGPYNLAKVQAIAGALDTSITADETQLPAVAAGQVVYWRLRETADDGRLSQALAGVAPVTEAP